MTKKELEARLDQALENYQTDMQSIASDPYGKQPITEGQLYEASKHIFYALNTLKKEILEYLP